MIAILEPVEDNSVTDHTLSHSSRYILDGQRQIWGSQAALSSSHRNKPRGPHRRVTNNLLDAPPQTRRLSVVQVNNSPRFPEKVRERIHHLPRMLRVRVETEKQEKQMTPGSRKVTLHAYEHLSVCGHRQCPFDTTYTPYNRVSTRDVYKEKLVFSKSRTEAREARTNSSSEDT